MDVYYDVAKSLLSTCVSLFISDTRMRMPPKLGGGAGSGGTRAGQSTVGSILAGKVNKVAMAGFGVSVSDFKNGGAPLSAVLDGEGLESDDRPNSSGELNCMNMLLPGVDVNTYYY